MRNFFLFLLLVNLLAFAYQSWIMEPAVSLPPDFTPQDVPQLLQVDSKRNSAPPDTASSGLAIAAGEPVQPTITAVGATNRCLRVGPFSRDSDADQIRRELQQQGVAVTRTAENGRVWLGYWVQTTAYKSRQAAEIARRSLINNDMPDVYVIAEDNEFRVSLGVFRLRASADEAVYRARSLGVATRTVERFRPGTNFWLIARVADLPDSLQSALPNVPGQILRSESIDCPADGI